MEQNIDYARHLIRKCRETGETYLDIGNCGITDLNDLPELFECTHLETLILCNNWWQFENGDVWSSKNENDGIINDIRYIPSNIVRLKKLTSLFINRDHHVKRVKLEGVHYLGQLTSLQTLHIGRRWLVDLGFLENLSRLHTLEISENDIVDIGFLKKLSQLERLDLWRNEISDISTLEHLPGLQELEIGSNPIKDFQALNKLNNLFRLSIPVTDISDIQILKNLTRLRRLELGHNKITDIQVLENLTELQTLDLINNQIRIVPESIFRLGMEVNKDNKKSEGLCLSDNPIESPPVEILKQGRQSVLDWFAATRKKLDEIKVILIGDPKAGKTSLLRRLKDDTFNAHEVQTDGINIEHISFGDSDTFKEQTSLHQLTGHFWDFGGQEIMNATHQFFLTNRSVYILVLDARKDASVTKQVGEWVKRIKATGGNSPIIVVVNQVDINPGFGFSNESELQKEYPQIKYFIRASCLDENDEGIKQIKQKLEELIPQAELFNTEIDERWIKIKEKLQQETAANHFLDEATFNEICSGNGLQDRKARKNAINFLHDLGLVLHFEGVNLAEYYVLDPYWITYGVYQIVTSSYAGKQKGKVSMDMLEHIVNEEEDKKREYNPAHYRKIMYTPTQRRFLVDILNQFKLCFYLPNHTHFIIPDLLDTKEPLEITEPIRQAEGAISFVYQYEYLPNAIMPYIMVEAHNRLHEMWRTGCVLSYNGCRALVTDYKNRLTITVTGEHKKKREFMAVIRHIVDEINQTLTDKPTMLIPLKDVDAYAEYEVLLNMELGGEKKYEFNKYKPTAKIFQISELLEGIPGQGEVSGIYDKLDAILKKTVENSDKMDTLCDKQDALSVKLDGNFIYLIERLGRNGLEAKILDAIHEVNQAQQAQLENAVADLMECVTTCFEQFDGIMDDKLIEVRNELMKTDNLQVKLGVSIPFVNLLGINLGAEFDIKNWAAKKYQQYEMKIFKLIS